jgi:CHAT domain-containing protein
MATWDLKNVDLVVLSACQTALGNKLGNGEEILGLGYTIQQRGAKATIASLWTVDDASTQQLMNIFYQELQKSKSTSEALRQAQIALITGKVTHPDANKNITQPYYWAAFIIIGNGF